MKPDVLVLQPTLAPQMEQLAGSAILHRYDLADTHGREGMLAGIGKTCRYILTDGHTPLGADLIARIPALRLVSCASAGYEMIDAEALRHRGVVLTNTSNALAGDVADTAIMLMLAARRGLVAAHDWVKSGDWGRKGMFPLQSSLHGKKLGIVGMGAIGQAILPRARAFGLQTAYFSRSAKAGVDATYEPDLVALAGWADILIVIVAGGPATRGLVDDRVIRALGPEGTLVNISRGTVIDETAMVAALADGGLGSAGLDVFLNEPTPDPALTSLPNVTLYPHHASGTVETRAAMAQLAVDNIIAVMNGKAPLSPVWT